MKKVAIIQSCYIPWKGYFDLINSVNTFIFYDDVQYTKNDWRNRNLISTANGTIWLTIPVHANLHMLIKDVCTTNNRWPIKHWKTIQINYAKAPYFSQYSPLFENLYLECRDLLHLSQINYKFIKLICEILNIKTELLWSMDYAPERFEMNDKTSRVISLCKSVNAQYYISGPAASSYINETLFYEAGIEIQYFNYEGYLPYQQLYEPFTHQVSILDLIFNKGPNASKYMKSF